MMQQAVTELFDRYEHEFNAGLAGETDLDAIGGLYEEAFIAASPAGVMTGKKGDELRKAMAAGFARYRAIGTRQMKIQNLQIEPIDALHALARVHWRATYEVKGAETEIDFANVYLIRVSDDRATVFGWITGDEDAELRRRGIID
jgi:hypothetical protein